jgi:hypothetical protein
VPEQDVPPSLEDLDALMDILGSALASGRPESKVPSLLMMAVLVGMFPSGDLQDAAENTLCTHIAEVRPNSEDLAEIRRKQREA